MMTTLRGSNGRRYEVQSQLYGTSNLVHRLYFGGVFLAATDERGPGEQSSSTILQTIERANHRAEEMGIEIVK